MHKPFALLVKLFVLAWTPLVFAHGALRGSAMSPLGFEWVEISQCRVPRHKPPPMPEETNAEYGFERRFLALEEGRPCILMEAFVEGLSGSSSSGMQVLGARLFRFERERWHEQKTGFLYFPYALRSKDEGRLFFVTAVLEEDVGVK